MSSLQLHLLDACERKVEKKTKKKDKKKKEKGKKEKRKKILGNKMTGGSFFSSSCTNRKRSVGQQCAYPRQQ